MPTTNEPRTTSQAQIDANRRNAQHSSGPRSSTGKAASSRNRLVHGLRANTHILLDEDPAEFQALLDDLLTRFQPVGPGEEMLVLRIAANQWRLNRAFPIEAGILREQVRFVATTDANRQPEYLRHQKIYEANPETVPPPPPPDGRDALARAFTGDCKGTDALTKLTRYENSLERSIDRALRQLKAYQAARLAAAEPALPESEPAEAPPEPINPVNQTNCHSNPIPPNVKANPPATSHQSPATGSATSHQSPATSPATSHQSPATSPATSHQSPPTS